MFTESKSFENHSYSVRFQITTAHQYYSLYLLLAELASAGSSDPDSTEIPVVAASQCQEPMDPATSNQC
jgi:hypothetical protein